MLVPAPYQVPAQEGKNKSEVAESDLHSTGMSNTMSGETEAPSPKDDGEGEGDIPSPHGRKRTASEDLEVEAPKRGKVSLPYGSGSEADVCWKYALEAIIKWLLLYFLVHDNCLLFML